jgi:hypothetical protein
VQNYEAVQRGEALSLTKRFFPYVKIRHGQTVKEQKEIRGIKKWEVILIG